MIVGASGGGQKIKIRAIDSNGNQVGSEKEVNGSIVNNINYNFYCQQYYFQTEKVNAKKRIMVHFLLQMEQQMY